MPDDNPERSSHLFTLAERFGVPLGPGEQDVLEDDSLRRFLNEYREWAPRRDAALKEHLLAHPDRFRCYLPSGPRVFQLAHQVHWYLDEVIVPDRVVGILETADTGALEAARQQLRQLLQVLDHFRPAIESGYVLLAGNNLVASMPEEVPERVRQLSGSPAMVSDLDRAVQFGFDRRRDDQGREWVLYQASLDTGGTMGWYVEKLSGTVQSPPFVVGEQLPPSSAEEISRVVGQDVLGQVRHHYPREVQRTVHAAGVAANLASAALFDRRVDGVILSGLEEPPLDADRQLETVASMNLALPYLERVPPRRLVDLREKMPDAFTEFRARMVKVVQDAMKEDPARSAEVARLAAARDVVPHLRQLQTEMEAAARKGRVLGYGLPAVSVMGALVGACIGAGPAALVTALVGGAAGAVHAAAGSIGDRKKAEANPFFFIWRARQG